MTVSQHFEQHGERARPTRVIGLTGGIGMGKSTISNYLETVHQLPVLDADIYAREAVSVDSPVFREIVERYGPTILMPNGQLDRMRLGDIIFNSAAERLWLEQQIHPYVRDRIELALDHLAAQDQTVAIVVVPLLFEARMTDLVTEIWVVNCTRDQQVARLMQRDTETVDNRRMNLDQIHARIDSQMPIAEKLKRADVVINNSSTLEGLFQEVDQALRRSPNPSISSH